MVVTPKFAEELLTRNPNNRDVSKSKVRQYADAMKRGQWMLNGENVKFDREGNILDGQHRLLAVVEADAEVPLTFVTGLPIEVKRTVDTGRNRSTADVLAMRGGVPSPRYAGSIVRLLIALRYEESGKSAANATITNTDVLDFIDGNPTILGVVEQALIVAKETGLNPASAGAALFQTFSANPSKAQEFFDGLVSGIGYENGDPRLALRRYAFNNRSNAMGHKVAAYCAYIKAWNAFLKGDSIQIMRVSKSEFPQVAA